MSSVIILLCSPHFLLIKKQFGDIQDLRQHCLVVGSVDQSLHVGNVV